MLANRRNHPHFYHIMILYIPRKSYLMPPSGVAHGVSTLVEEGNAISAGSRSTEYPIYPRTTATPGSGKSTDQL